MINFNKNEYMVSKCDKKANVVVLLSKPFHRIITARILITPTDSTTPINCEDAVTATSARHNHNDDNYIVIIIPSNTISQLVNVDINKPVNFQLRIDHNSLSSRVNLSCPSTANVIFYDITLSFTNALYTVNEDNRTAQLELMLSEPTCSTISVYVKIQQITAIKDEDYEVETSTMQTLFFGGKTCATFDVKIINDKRLESNETFNVFIDPLSLPYCIVLGNITTAEVVILDDDVANISFGIITYAVNEGDGQVELALNLSHPLPHEFDASLRLNSIDDINTTFISTENLRCHYKDGANYSVMIPANMTNFKYNFTIFDDDVLEMNETINLVIDSASHDQIRIINPYEASVTIMDDEERITVSFSKEEFIFNEANGIATPVLTLSKPSPCCLNLYVEVEDVTALGGGVDYGERENKTQSKNETQIANETQSGNKTQYLVTFPTGTTCSSVDIPINNDSISEDNETFNISILIMSLPFGVVLSGIDEAEVVIKDNDIGLYFNSTVYEIYEDDGQFCFNLTFTKPAIFDITVEVIEEGVTATSFNRTATEPGDYEVGPYSVNFTKGHISTMFCINITDDKDLEMDENFTLTINKTITHGSNDTELDYNHIVFTNPYMVNVTIIDDEYTFCFNEENYSVTEGNNVTLAINLSKPLPNDIMVKFKYLEIDLRPATANRTNKVNETNIDYYTQYYNFSAKVKKNTSNFLLNITILEDNELESNERFLVFAMPPEVPHHDNCSRDAIVTIEDNDYLVLEFEKRSYAVNTKNHPDVPLLMLHCPENYAIAQKTFPIKVNVSEVDGTATGGRTDDVDGADYVYQNYTYALKCGEEPKELIIRPLDDNFVEPDETYNLTIKLVSDENSYVKIGKNGTTTITIYNDDVCFIRIVRKDRKHHLYFSKPLLINITINVTDIEGKVTEIEKKMTNYYIELPVSKKRISKIEVYCIPVSLKDYIKVAGKKNRKLIILECN